MKNHQTLTEMESLFLALADKTRLRMLNLMREREVCVFLFSEILSENQPKISRHLAYLRNAGLVETRREGKMVYYRIIDLSHSKDAHISFMLKNTLLCLANQTEMQTEYGRLLNYYRRNKVFESIGDVSGDNTYAKQDIYAEKKELEIYLL